MKIQKFSKWQNFSILDRIGFQSHFCSFLGTIWFVIFEFVFISKCFRGSLVSNNCCFDGLKLPISSYSFKTRKKMRITKLKNTTSVCLKILFLIQYQESALTSIERGNFKVRPTEHKLNEKKKNKNQFGYN